MFCNSYQIYPSVFPTKIISHEAYLFAIQTITIILTGSIRSANTNVANTLFRFKIHNIKNIFVARFCHQERFMKLPQWKALIITFTNRMLVLLNHIHLFYVTQHTINKSSNHFEINSIRVLQWITKKCIRCRDWNAPQKCVTLSLTLMYSGLDTWRTTHFLWWFSVMVWVPGTT